VKNYIFSYFLLVVISKTLLFISCRGDEKAESSSKLKTAVGLDSGSRLDSVTHPAFSSLSKWFNRFRVELNSDKKPYHIDIKEVLKFFQENDKSLLENFRDDIIQPELIRIRAFIKILKIYQSFQGKEERTIEGGVIKKTTVASILRDWLFIEESHDLWDILIAFLFGKHQLFIAHEPPPEELRENLFKVTGYCKDKISENSCRQPTSRFAYFIRDHVEGFLSKDPKTTNKLWVELYDDLLAMKSLQEHAFDLPRESRAFAQNLWETNFSSEEKISVFLENLKTLEQNFMRLETLLNKVLNEERDHEDPGMTDAQLTKLLEGFEPLEGVAAGFVYLLYTSAKSNKNSHMETEEYGLCNFQNPGLCYSENTSSDISETEDMFVDEERISLNLTAKRNCGSGFSALLCYLKQLFSSSSSNVASAPPYHARRTPPPETSSIKAEIGFGLKFHPRTGRSREKTWERRKKERIIVRTVQKALRQAGAGGSIDGKYGKTTAGNIVDLKRRLHIASGSGDQVSEDDYEKFIIGSSTTRPSQQPSPQEPRRTSTPQLSVDSCRSPSVTAIHCRKQAQNLSCGRIGWLSLLSDGEHRQNRCHYDHLFCSKVFKASLYAGNEYRGHPNKVIKCSGIKSSAAGSYQYLKNTWIQDSKRTKCKNMYGNCQNQTALYTLRRRQLKNPDKLLSLDQCVSALIKVIPNYEAILRRYRTGSKKSLSKLCSASHGATLGMSLGCEWASMPRSPYGQHNEDPSSWATRLCTHYARSIGLE